MCPKILTGCIEMFANQNILKIDYFSRISEFAIQTIYLKVSVEHRMVLHKYVQKTAINTI